MNNEKRLYDLIKSKNNLLAMQDEEVAKELGVSKYTIPNYKKKLIKAGYIETKVRVIDNKPVTLYRTIKDYTGDIEW